MTIVAKPNADQFIYPYGDTVVGEYKKLHEACLKEPKAVVMEWANDMTAKLTQNKYPGRVTVRVHDHEVYAGRVDHVNWENVDNIWFVNEEVRQNFEKRIPDHGCKTFVLPNAILPQQFQEKEGDPYEIGMLCIFPKERKRINRALDLMAMLPEHHLTVRVDPSGNKVLYDKYIKRIVQEGLNVTFEAHFFDHTKQKEKAEVSEFFKDKGWVLSTSEHEAFHYAIAEGALCGCEPLVYNWEFGDPYQFWGPFIFDTVQDMASHVQNSGPESARGFVVEHYDAKKLKEELEELV